MPGTKRLRSIAHSFAQHALGPLSPWTPERSLEQRQTGLASISVQLLGQRDVEVRPEVSALQQCFVEFLSKENVSVQRLRMARAEFQFQGQCQTPSRCAIVIRPIDGKVVQDVVNEAMRRDDKINRS